MDINQKKLKRGVTLTEMMIIVGIIGIVFFMTSTVIRFMNGVSRERLAYEAQRDVEATLYLVSRDVRNAQQIVSITPTTLTLRVFNLSLGYDVNTAGNDFWNPAKLRWLTYSYQTGAGGKTWLRKQLFAPDNATLLEQKESLVNVLEPDDPATVPVERIFTPNPVTATSDFNTVQIEFRVRPRGYDLPVKIYKTQAMIRRTSDT